MLWGSETGSDGGSSVVQCDEHSQDPIQGLWAQMDPGASLGCFAGDPTAFPGQAVRHKQNTRMCCWSLGKESHVS